MTAEQKINPQQTRPILLPPWLVVLGALLLYGLTLNSWVTLRSLPAVSLVTGWDWHPYPLPWRGAPLVPLFMVVTYPIRLLPLAWQPLALNAFSALCAALTLGLLARSVRLLAHDRTRDQRLREQGEYSLLSVRAAFLPALFAVLMLGLQRTFWQNAIAATGEILDLLLFAFLIWCLLEFRVRQNDRWLLVYSFVYGLGVTNNWALIGFFPLFLIAVIWLKGLAFFNLRFLARMSLCGLAGLLLYALLPLIQCLGGNRDGFWLLLRQEVGMQLGVLHLVPRWVVLMAAMPTVLPLLFAAIRWPSFEGEISAAGGALTQFGFRMLHLAFLLLPLVLFFDFKFSPSVAMREVPIGFLTFYYVGALCVGYFSGYLLLVFGAKMIQVWERPGPARKVFRKAMVALVWLLAAGAPLGLACQNVPYIRAANSDGLKVFADQTLDGLPAKGALILSDDPSRLFLLEATYLRRGIPNQNILIETRSLAHREYIRYLISRYAELKAVMTPPDRLPPVLPTQALESFMYLFGRNHLIYYLHPSFGYYFELFFLKPHGLVYELKSYPNKSPQPPLPTEEEIKANQVFWAALEKETLDSLPQLAKLDPDLEVLSTDYSVALDFWGADLQKANRLKEANAKFAEAVKLNHDNFIARINLAYNGDLQKGNHRPINSQDMLYHAISEYHGLEPVLELNGPADEPGLDLELGEVLAQGGNLRQAAALFTRRLELLPGDTEAEFAMAKTYADLAQVDKALEFLRKLRGDPKISSWQLNRVEAMAYVAATNFPAAEQILQNALKEDPNDPARSSTLAEFYRRQAYDAQNHRNPAEAAHFFSSALTNVEHELQVSSGPGRPAGEHFDLVEALLRKAELQMMLSSFTAAITTFNQILQIQPQNLTALFNRALANVQLKKMREARDDYQTFARIAPRQSYAVDYRLAEIAALEKNLSEETRCLKRYLKSAPQETAEYQEVRRRLQKLEGH
jgi:tetratricopeptide (TPR) repeat protein